MSNANTETESAMKDIAARVSKGECILFLGAGIHSPPPEDSPYRYPENERPPMGGAFSERLAENCGFVHAFPKEDPRNLQRVSLYYEIGKSRYQLVEEIKDAVQAGKKPSPLLRGLAGLDFPLVITTNYDRLFEKALEDADRELQESIYSPEQSETEDHPDPTPQRPFVFKIHGDVTRPTSIVITDEDYIQFVLRMSDKDPYYPVPMTFLYRFRTWSTLFVGYSLTDYNFRLLFKTLRWKIDKANIPDAYSVDLLPDPLIVNVYHDQQRYVKFIAQDVWTFVPKLYRMIRGEEMPA
jgi:hypothetical protein